MSVRLVTRLSTPWQLGWTPAPLQLWTGKSMDRAFLMRGFVLNSNSKKLHITCVVEQLLDIFHFCFFLFSIPMTHIRSCLQKNKICNWLNRCALMDPEDVWVCSTEKDMNFHVWKVWTAQKHLHLVQRNDKFLMLEIVSDLLISVLRDVPAWSWLKGRAFFFFAVLFPTVHNWPKSSVCEKPLADFAELQRATGSASVLA